MVEDAEIGPGRYHRVVTFLSVFDVHVQRCPVEGEIVHSELRRGAQAGRVQARRRREERGAHQRLRARQRRPRRSAPARRPARAAGGLLPARRRPQGARRAARRHQVRLARRPVRARELSRPGRQGAARAATARRRWPSRAAHRDRARRAAGVQRRLRRGAFLLPSAFTIGNLFLGFYAVIVALGGRFETAGVCILVAGILDSLDGRIARMTGTESEFGTRVRFAGRRGDLRRRARAGRLPLGPDRDATRGLAGAALLPGGDGDPPGALQRADRRAPIRAGSSGSPAPPPRARWPRSCSSHRIPTGAPG